jgi:hypothetical protein
MADAAPASSWSPPQMGGSDSGDETRN